MRAFTWRDEYSIAVPELDEQHQGLFALAGRLRRDAEAGECRAALRDTLFDLLGRSQRHFATEERLMAESSFADYTRHQHQHAQFVEKAVALAGEFEAGRADLTATVLPFLGRWMTHHITHEDRKLGQHLNQAGSEQGS